MKQRLSIFVRYYLYWIILFALQKPLFMLTQYAQMGKTDGMDWLRVVVHALPLDLSVASYITAGFGILMVLSFFFSSRVIRKITDGYTLIILAISLLIWIGDIGTFPSWGYHLDKTLFMYFFSPKEMLACAEWWVWLIGILAWVGCITGAFIVYRKVIPIQYEPVQPILRAIGQSLCMVVLTALLFIPIRGSLGTSTMNTGRVYFSSNQMVNMAAVNPVFNLIESLEFVDFDTERYTFMSSQEASETLAPLLTKADDSTHISILNTARPDIVLIIVESLSANVIETLGGTAGITPHLNAYSQEGVLFTHAYASSYRTDRGVVAVMSAFPGQPTSSLMVVPSKCHNLPYWSRQLEEQGYHLRFFYGGDEDFTSMRSYLIDAGFYDRVSDKSFPISDRLSKWGAPDAVLLDRAAQDILSTERNSDHPSLDVILTLSSHEPFDVPVHTYDIPYLNGVAYTDSCIGAFVERLRQSPRWDSTLIIITGDHGFPYPETAINTTPERYHLPILFFGGAVQQPMEVVSVCSQIDIGPTLLSQLHIPIDRYIFAKDALNTSTPPFAFFAFNDGFGMADSTGITIIDRKVNKVVYENHPNEQREHRARAFVQSVYEAIEKL